MKRFFSFSLFLIAALIVVAGCKERAGTSSAKEVKKMEPYKARDFSYLVGTPGFSENALKLHFALYEGYVKNTNLLLEKMDEMVSQGKSQTPEFSELKRRFGFEFNGMRLHEYYFSSLGGNGLPNRESDLYKAIVASFGSFENWQKDFVSTAMSRGIGWALLCYDEIQDRLINVWINEHHVGHLAGCRVIFPLDLFEHAFIVDYGLDKKTYVDTVLKAINWKVLEERFKGRPFPQK